MGDRRRIAWFGAASMLALAGIIVMRVLMPSPLAPRINVRWEGGVAAGTREQLERRFTLLAGRVAEGTTWSYDLGDPSAGNVKALLSDPAVEDTLHIDRERGVVPGNAPRGTTVIAGGVLAWRDSPALEWLGIFFACAALTSAIWLAASRR